MCFNVHKLKELIKITFIALDILRKISYDIDNQYQLMEVLILTALIVGGDKLGNIPKILNTKGYENYIHWSGRKKGMRAKLIPNNVDMIIVLYDFIEHNLTNSIKKQSRSMDIPCIFTKRTCSDLSRKLNCCKYCPQNCKRQ